MAAKYFCDICEKELDKDYITVFTWPRKFYCKVCWSDKTKWKQIHELEKENK
jgi:hypothetical protein